MSRAQVRQAKIGFLAAATSVAAMNSHDHDWFGILVAAAVSAAALCILGVLDKKG